jgi:hypothetical protein
VIAGHALVHNANISVHVRESNETSRPELESVFAYLAAALTKRKLPRVKRGDSFTEINSRLAVASITPKA